MIALSTFSTSQAYLSQQGGRGTLGGLLANRLSQRLKGSQRRLGSLGRQHKTTRLAWVSKADYEGWQAKARWQVLAHIGEPIQAQGIERERLNDF